MLRARYGLVLMSYLAVSGVTIAATPSETQPLPPIRGSIEKISGNELKLKTRNGQSLSVALTEQTEVQRVSLADPEDIKPDSFIGSAARPNPDGTLTALEVHVFEPRLRGTGEGHQPFIGADGQTSTMTNGRVGSLIISQGRKITVQYGNEEKTILVPENVPIVSIEASDRSELKPGAKVVLFPTHGAAGELTAKGISVGKDGLTPPM